MSSNDDTESREPLVFGVPSSTVAEALRRAGLAEQAVVAVLGRAVARSASAPPSGAADVAGASGDAAPAVSGVLAPGPANPGPVVVNPGPLGSGFRFQVNIAQTAPECGLTYNRLFVHPDFIDGVTVVQAGQTPDEIGFNARFHALEAEFDSISRNLQTSSNCMAELRLELYLLARELEAKITEIEARLDAKGKDKDTKEGKESKEGKEGKEAKEKDTKEGKDKEGKDHKDGKDKDHPDKLAAGLEKITAIEGVPLRPDVVGPPDAPTPAAGTARTFISLEDRPDVQAAALGEDQATPTAPADVPGEGPADVPGEAPADVPGEGPADVPAEGPAEGAESATSAPEEPEG